MNRDYWINRWKENRIGFHKAGVNPLLERFWPRVAAAHGRTLVPLCGKSDDLAWIAGRGHDVVGVDLSEIAARAFASEHRLEVTVTESPPFTVLRDGHITYLAGDFFDLTPENAGLFNLAYDRAALIAMPEDRRPAYARQLRSMLEPGAQILLIALEYDPQQMSGPPHTVPESEVRTLFAGHKIEKLQEVDCLEDEPRFRERGLKWMKEIVYHIR
jgi:thiopurine S-methyltransferase